MEFEWGRGGGSRAGLFVSRAKPPPTFLEFVCTA